MISRSVSGEGESLKAALIHCSFGMTTSRARIAAPVNQFTTMRIRSMTYATGSAADDEAGVDMFRHSLSNINNIFIDYRQPRYWKTIRNQMTSPTIRQTVVRPFAVPTTAAAKTEDLILKKKLIQVCLQIF